MVRLDDGRPYLLLERGRLQARLAIGAAVARFVASVSAPVVGVFLLAVAETGLLKLLLPLLPGKTHRLACRIKLLSLIHI